MGDGADYSAIGIAVPHLETYAYSTSKAALHHLTKVLASQLAAKNITVNAVAPVWMYGYSRTATC